MITFTQGVNVLTLRNPNLGDSQKHNIQITHGIAMDGEVYTYKKSPAYSTLLLVFTDILAAKAAEAALFFRQHAGQELTYVDQNSDTWVGRIVTDPIEYKTVETSNCATYTFTIEFSCVKT